MPVPPYDEAGRGPAMVFSHGTMMDRSMFRPQLDALSCSFRVIAFDHRARTARWRGPYSLDDLASDCLALLDALGIERCVLLSEAVAQRNADILFGVTTRSQRPELVEAWKTRWRDLTGPSVYWETASWLHREDLSSRLGEISVPTLVIHGEEDIIIPIAAGEEMANGVQNGSFVRVANAGHTANLEDPDAVNAAISDFVESLVLAP